MTRLRKCDMCGEIIDGDYIRILGLATEGDFDFCDWYCTRDFARLTAETVRTKTPP